jgi:hypothetical protein
MTRRRLTRILAAAALLLAGACENKGSDTKLMLAVWSDLQVPMELDQIHMDVNSTTSKDFVLSAGLEKVPVVLEIASSDGQATALQITITGLRKRNSVAVQRVQLSFDPGQSHVLKIFLAHGCGDIGAPPLTQVEVTTLPRYDSSTRPLRPDASAAVCADAGVATTDTESIDGVADAQPGSDLEADLPATSPDTVDAASADSPLGPDEQQAPPDLPPPFDVLPDLSRPDVVALPDLALPDLARSDLTPPDLARPDLARSDVALPDLPLPESAPNHDDAPNLLDSAIDESPDTASDEVDAVVPPPLDSGLDQENPEVPPVCTLPMISCPAGCINPDTSVSNCGGCDQACGTRNGTPNCAARICSVSSCSPGFLNCSADENLSRDGCETDGNTDSVNCGHCGNVCSSRVCRSQTCLATARYGYPGPGSGSLTSPFSQDFLAGISVDVPNDAVLTGLGVVLFNGNVASPNMYLGLYKDVAGSPGDRVATVNAPAKVSPGGKEFIIDPPVDIRAGTYWILGVWSDLATFASNSATLVNWRFVSYPYAALPTSAPPGMTQFSLPAPDLYVIVAQ